MRLLGYSPDQFFGELAVAGPRLQKTRNCYGEPDAINSATD
jgi:hypothetical protein